MATNQQIQVRISGRSPENIKFGQSIAALARKQKLKVSVGCTKLALVGRKPKHVAGEKTVVKGPYQKKKKTAKKAKAKAKAKKR